MTIEEALKKIALLEGVTKELDEKLTEYKSKDIETLESKVKSYEDLGSVEDIESLLKTAEDMKKELDEYRELGEAKELEEALDSMATFTENFYTRLGENIEQVEEALNTAKETIETYKEFGTPDDIEELLATAVDLNESVKAYSTLLTVEEAETIVESYEAELVALNTASLVESFNISEAFATEMLEKWGSLQEAESALAAVAGSLKKNESEDSTEGETPVEGTEGEPAKIEESTTVPAKSMKSRLHNLLGLN